MRSLIAFALGGICVLGFAPHRIWWLPLLAIAWFFARLLRANSVKRAAWDGFAFGLGLFGVGASWVFVALNTFGQMPAAMAGVATLLFCSFLALYPALAAALSRWVAPSLGNAAPFIAAGFFVACEWLRGWIFTGFPWLSMDHPHASDSPLIGFAPLVGGLGVSFIACLLSALIAWAWPRPLPRPLKSCAAGILIGVVLIVGHSLKKIEWSQAAQAQPLTVSLVQGNIAQQLKFDPKSQAENAAHFSALMQRAQGALVILPETTVTTLMQARADDPIMGSMRAAMKPSTRALLFGAPQTDGVGIFNAAIALENQAINVYRKTHLVPFGEFMPLRPLLGWFYDNMAIPLSGFSEGAPTQSALSIAGEKLGISICYEDVFARAVRPQALDATLLINLTNDAWYGQSSAAEQHAQIAQMRAAEFARPMLRATNTGITVAIDHRGQEIARLPWFTRDILELKIHGRTGPTPYMAMGDLPVLLILLAMGAIAICLRLQRRIE